MEAYGIDLGTTNSCISLVDEHGQPRAVRIGNSDTVPSIVFYDKGEIKVGVKNNLKSKPENCVTAIKRKMGDNSFSVTIDGRKLTPTVVSSHILRYLVDKANEWRAGKGLSPINKVVISVPADFQSDQIEATKEAGILAGLDVLKIIEEPTAAALSYGLDNKSSQNQTVLVYDLGGGTFDSTILKFVNNNVEIIAKKGDQELGGINWDIKIIEEYYKKLDKIIPQETDSTYRRILIEVEEAKKVLTTDDETCISFFSEGMGNVDLTRARFEQITQSLLRSTINCIEQAAKDVNLLKDGKLMVDKIILVGGSSWMPMVKRAIQQQFGLTPIIADPDLAISKGAAILAASILRDGDKGGDIIKGDIVAYSYGLKIANSNDNDSHIHNVIFKNEPKFIEERVFSQFVTKNENQEGISIVVYRNESKDKVTDIKKGILTVKKNLTWGYPVKKGTPIKYTISRDKDGILKIIAEAEGKKEKIEVSTL